MILYKTQNFTLLIPLGLTQNHEKTNRQVRQVRQGIRVAESFCVSPVHKSKIVKDEFGSSVFGCREFLRKSCP